MISGQVLVVAALVVGAFLFVARRERARSASFHELVEREGALLVDVRSRGEFADGHIAGARNIPLDELSSRLAELPAKDAAIVVYCRSGARSASARRVLANAGFVSVHDLGAMGRW